MVRAVSAAGDQHGIWLPEVFCSPLPTLFAGPAVDALDEVAVVVIAIVADAAVAPLPSRCLAARANRLDARHSAQVRFCWLPLRVPGMQSRVGRVWGYRWRSCFCWRRESWPTARSRCLGTPCWGLAATFRKMLARTCGVGSEGCWGVAALVLCYSCWGWSRRGSCLTVSLPAAC